MAFPAGFSFESEDHFIETLVVPLLNRLGYSLVLDCNSSAASDSVPAAALPRGANASPRISYFKSL